MVSIVNWQSFPDTNPPKSGFHYLAKAPSGPVFFILWEDGEWKSPVTVDAWASVENIKHVS